MASLRKKYAPDVSTPDPAPAVEAAVGTSPAPPPPSIEPSPEIAQPQDDAGRVLQAHLDAIRRAETVQEQAQIAMLAAQERRNAWLEATPGAKENIAALNILHQHAIQSGFADTSPEYFSFLENQLATLQRPAPAASLINEMQQRVAQVQPQEQPKATRPRAVPVSAPVSREVPSAGGGFRTPSRITLTLEQREAAKMSGVSETEYAKQLLRLRELQASGEYSDRR
jgi:hypothetical protein